MTTQPTDDADGEATAAFEAAQRRLLDDAGVRAESRFVDLERPRVRVHVLEAGTPGDDVPLAFVHGTAGFGAVFAPLLAHLGDARVILLDRPGYGLSDPYAYAEETIQAVVVDVLAGVLDALGVERVDLVGHSMGGHAGIRFALAHPDRVRRLVLLGAVPGFPGTRPPVPLRLFTAPGLGRLLRARQREDVAGVLDVAEVFGEREAIQDHPALLRAMAAHEADPKSAAAGMSEFGALFSLRGWHSTARLREAELETLAHPTTVVWGDRDPLGGPAAVREGVAAIPDATVESVDAGHIPFLGHPERCARLVQASGDADATRDPDRSR